MIPESPKAAPVLAASLTSGSLTTVVMELTGRPLHPLVTLTPIVIAVVSIPFFKPPRETSIHDRKTAHGVVPALLFISLTLLVLEAQRHRLELGNFHLDYSIADGGEDNGAWLASISHLISGGASTNFGGTVNVLLAPFAGISSMIGLLDGSSPNSGRTVINALGLSYSAGIIASPWLFLSTARAVMQRRGVLGAATQGLAFVLLLGFLLEARSWGHLTAFWTLLFVTYATNRIIIEKPFDGGSLCGLVILSASCGIWKPLWPAAPFLTLVILKVLVDRMSGLDHPRRLLRVSLRLYWPLAFVLLGGIILDHLRFEGGTPSLSLAFVLATLGLVSFTWTLEAGGHYITKLASGAAAYAIVLRIVDNGLNDTYGYGSTKLTWVLFGLIAVGLLSNLPFLPVSSRNLVGFFAVASLGITGFSLTPEIERANRYFALRDSSLATLPEVSPNESRQRESESSLVWSDSDLEMYLWPLPRLPEACMVSAPSLGKPHPLNYECSRRLGSLSAGVRTEINKGAMSVGFVLGAGYHQNFHAEFLLNELLENENSLESILILDSDGHYKEVTQVLDGLLRIAYGRLLVIEDHAKLRQLGPNRSVDASVDMFDRARGEIVGWVDPTVESLIFVPDTATTEKRLQSVVVERFNRPDLRDWYGSTATHAGYRISGLPSDWSGCIYVEWSDGTTDLLTTIIGHSSIARDDACLVRGVTQ